MDVGREHLLSYVAGGLLWSATLPDTTALQRGLRAWQQLTGQGHNQRPFFLICDLATLVDQGYATAFASRNYESWPPERRALRLRYENEILGRLLREPVVEEALDILRFYPDPRRNTRLLEILVDALGPHYPAAVAVNPAHTRSMALMTMSPEVLEDRSRIFEEFMGDDEFFSRHLTTFLDNVAKRVAWSNVLCAEDLFELQHLDVLDTSQVRIGCRQVLTFERLLGDVDVHGVVVAEDSPETEIAFVDTSIFPTGGLAGLTCRGSIESLVPSELAYLDSGGDIDLFDLRMLEHEQLFFLRDSGTLTRKRRTIHFVVDADELMWVKSRGYEMPFAALVQGLVLRTIHDLTAVFEHDALAFHLHYVCTGESERLAEETKVMALLLHDEMERGLVHLHKDAEPDDFVDPHRKVYVVALATQPMATYWLNALSALRREHPAVSSVIVALADEAPRDTVHLPLNGLGLPDLVAMRNTLVRSLVGTNAV